METRGSERRSGWVADYCRICRDVEAHAIVLDQPARERAADPMVECAGCGLRGRVSPLRYLSVAPARPESLATLMARTFPRLPLEVEERVRFEKRALEGRLEAPERLEAIREPFLLIPPISGGIGVLTFAQAALGAGLVYMTLSAVANAVPLAAGSVLRFVGALLAAACAGVFLWRRSGGFARRARLAMLARSLRPLRPTVHELESTLSWARGMGIWVGSRFSARQVATAMARRPDRSLTNVDEMRLLEHAAQMRERLAATDGSSAEGDADRNEWSSA